MIRLLREPILHFLLLGGMLMFVQQNWGRQLEVLFRPQHIEISQADRERLQREWLGQTGRLPDAAEMAALVDQRLDEELLLREARRLGLHERDPVVRQRLVRNMRFVEQTQDGNDQGLLDAALALGMLDSDPVVRRRLIQRMRHRIESDVTVTEAQARDYYETHVGQFERPARYHFRHIYFSSNHPQPLLAASELLPSLGAASPEQARPAGDPFLLGQEFKGVSAREITKMLGSSFAANITSAPQGQWTGPLESIYGQHLVYLESVQPGRPADYATVRSAIVARLYAEQEAAALRRELNALRQRYRFRIAGSAGGDSA